ncbi:MAG: hypothetical protein LBF37_01770 [Rickettsiales bacterium]|nr:hypothetical protein [Rickettsiales bacterium]
MPMVKGAFEQLLKDKNIKGTPAFADQKYEDFNVFVAQVRRDSILKQLKAEQAAGEIFLFR